jgi:glycosyltransferase involved in cell wall biosynthesis
MAEAISQRVIPGRVTVITAVYNGAAHLRRCLESVQAQDYPDIEHVVMDGGSQDGSVDILRQQGGRIVWKSEPDAGIYDAWNKAIALATGEWIGFIGCDDQYLPGAIAAYMHALAGTDLDYMSSRVRLVSASGRARIIGEPWAWPRFQVFMNTAHVGSMHRQRLFERYGTYDTSFRMVGDYELLLRAGANLRASFIERVTAEMQAGGVTDSFASLHEAERAKVNSGRRNAATARRELRIAQAKLVVRRVMKQARAR